MALKPQRQELTSRASAGDRDRDRLARRSRELHEEVSELGSLPECKNPERRAKARESLRFFLTEYFPNSTGLSPLCEDQLNAIDRLEVAIREEGWTANILPRGFIKSTMSENAILWALLFGLRSYILFFGGTAELAEKGVGSIRQELISNDLLREDFPEACEPFIALQGKVARCPSQTYQGVLTGIQCNKDTLRLARIDGAECSGGIVESYGLLAPPRGARFKDHLGRNVRPDFAVLDDPQTDKSAKSLPQTAERLEFIKSSISMMGGHGAELSMVCNATIIADGDLAAQISDPNKSPEWQAIRVRMVKRMPDRLDDLWLVDYAKIRRSYDRNDPRGRIKAKERSTEFYKQNYEAMRAGAEVAWEHIGLSKTEIDAVQHAMNILIDKGDRAFWAEAQNCPLQASVATPLHLDADELVARTNNYGYGVIPDGRGNVVFHVDVHDEVLYWTVAAVGRDFTGDVIGYGSWPEQPQPWFNLRSAKVLLSDLYPDVDSDMAIEKGVKDLLSRLLAYEFCFSNRERLPVSCGLVDAGYKSKQVANAIRAMDCGDRVMTSKGVGIGPEKKQMPDYDMSPNRVLRCGPVATEPRWYYPVEYISGGVLRVHFDSNFWKAVLVSRLNQSATEGAWRLFGNHLIDHGHYVSHLMAEKPVQKTADGRTVNVFVKGNEDNHWFDTLVGCAVAASIMGCQLPSDEVEQVDEASERVITDHSERVHRLERPDGRPFFVSAR